MKVKMFSLILRAVLSLFNLLAFGFFICLLYFIDEENKYFFKWFLGNETSRLVYDRYRVSIFPAWWIRYLVYTLFAWQGLWMVFAVAILFKKKFPDALNFLFYVLFISSSGLEIAFIIFVSRNMILPACVASFSAVSLKVFALVLSYVKFEYEYEHEEHSLGDFWGFQLLILNGLVGYVVVLWFNSLMWLSIVLNHRNGVPELTTTTVSLTLAITSAIIWFILENLVFLWITRFTFSIYPVSIVTLTASLLENWNPSSRNSIILAVLLGIVCLFFALHVIRVTFRLVRARRSYATRNAKRKAKNQKFLNSIEFMTTRF
ncbi:uncharacterized protein LOC116305482 [Actinia tenebrosa]|uniref:Uncharacterized protein LOC116305482 n=1 Tax=Actinia tenebrosa TaxID=6105 RepID=A0A6P8IZU8_ACTTE|nr:uncharacterized protein LOC116305482 [Actinia tenebrosa]